MLGMRASSCRGRVQRRDASSGPAGGVRAPLPPLRAAPRPVDSSTLSSSNNRGSAACSSGNDSSSTGPASTVTRAMAAALAAALLLTAGAPAPGAWAAVSPRADVAALAAVEDDDPVMEQYASDMEEMAEAFDPDVAAPRELLDFLRLFERGTPSDLKKLDAAREAVGFRRGPDGRVALLSEGEEFEVKADMMAPGYLLLRDARGYCYFLPPDPSGRLQQIDLSDDIVVAQLFANGMWQDVIEPLEAMRAPDGDSNASSGEMMQLRMTDEEWRGVSSLLRDADELPEEPLEDLEGGEDAQ